ncbi:oligoendopeptidase F [Sutcliffiella rhizosphaerae]|uniref:Oligopeptidase F n=1 Tax=Sutcliffiella rhizosphaerae TaxID=2880967 RepID=A0ABM8YNE3_9BACI|nr:oligoendopeptidase F [Sutcliffiella rhizosphaerae]CAG9621483.1 Oligoendopeptidase F, plasmid [Sutcliffiella rhizosphaerae]
MRVMRRIVITVFSVVLCLNAMTVQSESHTFKSRADIPDEYKWNLQNLYNNEKEWRQDVQQVKKMAEKFSKKEEKLTNDKQILKLLKEYFTLSQKIEKIFVFSRINLDVDIGNTKAQALSEEGQNMMMYVVERTAWFSNEIQSMEDNHWAEVMQSQILKPYQSFLKETYDEKIHSLSPEMEKMLIKTMPMVNAPSELFTMMSKDLVLPSFTIEEKEYELTAPLYTKYMTGKNRKVREAAFKTYYGTLEKYQDSFASMLSNVVKGNNFFATARQYSSSLEAHLERNQVDPKVYDQLIETVEDGLPLLHRYLKLKEKYIGIDSMQMYDLSAPSPYTKTERIPYEEAKEIVVKGLAPIGTNYVKELSKGLDSKWVDVYHTPGKATGAYQIGSFDSHPYVLMNYQGLQNDVLTLAHEMGHAMHSYFSNKNQPYHDARYVTFTAEVASTLQEHLLHKQLLKEATTKEEKLHALYQYLEDFRVTLFRQTQFAEFEKIIHEMGQNEEPLHAEALKKVYLDLNKKYYGKGMEVNNEIAMEWARVPHFFHSSFYTYQYATSFAASAALAEQLEEDGIKAQKRIQYELFSSGGSLPPLEILQRTGVDMSKKQPIVESLNRYEELLNEFEKLLKS